MKARELIGGMALGFAALKVIEKSFDEAWQEIAAISAVTLKRSPQRA